MTLRTRIALAFALITAAVVIILSSFVYLFFLDHTHDYFFTRLSVRASISAETRYSKEHDVQLLRNLRVKHLQQLPREESFFFDNKNDIERQLKELLPGLPSSFAADLLEDGYARHHRGFLHYAGLVYPADGTHVVVARAYDENAENLVSFLFTLLTIGLIVICLFVFVIGLVFARRMMKPISTIITQVQTITASNLGERLSEDKRTDELGDMARTFNMMLDRLETTFELQSNFISNASHELRTPLTAILGEAEIVLQHPRTSEAYESSLKVIQEEAFKLEEITASLLKLSQISFDGRKQKVEPVALDELLMSIKIDLDRRHPSNQVKIFMQPSLETSDDFTLNCIRPWMELAIVNIINNSIKYSDNKEVLVSISSSGNKTFIQVSDSGIGIPQPELRKVFEPFFRASNTTRFEGHGIGLPLAARIIKLHRGKIDITSNSGTGTKVTMQFPRKEVKE